MILYFSGTGNSKYVAKRIADALGDALVNLNDRIKSGDTSPVETGERLPEASGAPSFIFSSFSAVTAPSFPIISTGEARR